MSWPVWKPHYHDFAPRGAHRNQTYVSCAPHPPASWELRRLLSGPYDERSARLTISAGAGGVDAMDWAEMLERMYTRCASVCVAVRVHSVCCAALGEWSDGWQFSLVTVHSGSLTRCSDAQSGTDALLSLLGYPHFLKRHTGILVPWGLVLWVPLCPNGIQFHFTRPHYNCRQVG